MSFGHESAIEVIDEALEFAERHNLLLLAASSNVGGNTGRARRWPGSRHNVISMCATDGNGAECERNPPPRDNTSNFATFGVTAPVWWSVDSHDFDVEMCIYRTGTSVATPIAAAIAALIIESVWRKSSTSNHTLNIRKSTSECGCVVVGKGCRRPAVWERFLC
jgi:hypothetical protein